MRQKKMEVNKSIGPSTEDGDAYCVDDDEEEDQELSDDDDELEREQVPTKKLDNFKAPSQLELASRNASQQ